jgi:stage II sporulation protein D
MRRALLAGLLAVVAAIVAAVMPAMPVAAADCQPAGGEAIPRPPAPPGDFQITGAGWGHGAGMSQYGAQGAARLGCDAHTILRTYYPGADVASTEMPGAIRVALDTGALAVPVEALTADVPWELCAASACTPLPESQPAESIWTVAVQADGSYQVTDGGVERWRGGDRDHVLRVPHDGTVVRLPTTGRSYRWGVLEFDSVPAGPAWVMLVNAELAFERYLYGVAEVPSSWPAAALEAQAIAARSYALSRREGYGGERPGCRCDVYATTLDQVYAGYDK